MKKFVSLLLVFSILLLSGNLFAKERKGADLIIEKTDGTQVRGELIAAKENSLLLLGRESGADIAVDIEDIKIIKIVKKSNAGGGLILGVAIGGAFGYLSSKKSEPVPNAWMSSDFRPLVALAGGILGGLVGLVIGAFAGTDNTFRFDEKSDSEIQEILEKLRKKARIKNAL